ncbi:MAG: GTPase ObgE [Thermoproteota archaeon]
MFIDEVRVYARGGRGGNGCIAFLREPFKPKGGPAGGDGGRGGNVILIADENVQDLTAQLFEPQLIAEDGEHGKGKGMHGRKGKDLLVRVPCGTIVWRIKRLSTKQPQQIQPGYLSQQLLTTNSADKTAILINLENAPAEEPPHWHDVKKDEQLEFVADLIKHGQRILLCRGGRGGRGNRHFATPDNQTPRYAEPGEPGEEGLFLLELRTIADIGLVGYPNAGKSSLLAALTNARPKIAPYPFTTLHPHVGIIEYEDWYRISLCDIPGLVEGAHKNLGLGHDFLRHIRRCRALIFIIDIAATDGRDPLCDLRTLKEELALYDPLLLDRRCIIAANKIDLIPAVNHLQRLRAQLGPNAPIFPISTIEGSGLKQLRAALPDLIEGQIGIPVHQLQL